MHTHRMEVMAVLSALTVLHPGPPRAGAAPAGVSHPPSTVGSVDDPGEHRSGFAVIDVETTGFSPELERIVEVGVVLLDPSGHEIGAFCTLVDPGL